MLGCWRGSGLVALMIGDTNAPAEAFEHAKVLLTHSSQEHVNAHGFMTELWRLHNACQGGTGSLVNLQTAVHRL